MFTMAQIVFVHGIANEQFTADRLQREWKEQLAGGIRIAGDHELADHIMMDRSLPGAIDSRMAFYGYLFLRPGIQGGEESEFKDETLAEEIAEAWLYNVEQRSRDEDEREAAERARAEASRQSGMPQGGGAMARWGINTLTSIPWITLPAFGIASFLYRALDQVTRYLTDPVIRPTAQEAVLDLIGPETRAVIAHSLGTVVAWEALQRRPPADLPLLITLGSPLGLRKVVYERLSPAPPIYPPNLRRWVNIADRDDFIAADRNLNPLFPGGNIEGCWTPDNGAEPHNANFYLGKKMVGEAVAKALRR